MIDLKPTTHEGYRLLADGARTMAQIEANGIRVDVDYVKQAREDLAVEQKRIKRELQKDDLWRKWQKRHGHKAKITSDDQMGDLLYNVLKYPVLERTDTGKPSTDEEALSDIPLPFVKKWIEMKKAQKLQSTYLRGIQREVADSGYIHPVFSLHTTVTYRSSSEAPNFQNQPTRIPYMAKMIRRSFVPSPGHVIVENDFAGVEVRVAACYHKDKKMLQYINDPSKDMHRDMAAQCMFLDSAWVAANGKKHRGLAKGGFVFSQFYGAQYTLCAGVLWKGMKKDGLLGPDGSPMHEWLRKKGGIEELGAAPKSWEEEPGEGTYMKFLKEVETDFWNNRFRQYGQWRKDWVADYQRKGYFDTLTGFRIAGVFARNDVINYGVQGSAFHVLLWCLTEINRELAERGMKSRICGQIHDSCVGDVHRTELAEYCALVRDVLTVRVMKRFPWLIVPLDIEYEITPDNGTWYDKQNVDYGKDGSFTIKDRFDDKKKHHFTSHKDLVLFMRKQHTQYLKNNN